MDMSISGFQFSTATQIIFASGKFHETVPQIAAYGKRALVTSGVSGTDLESEITSSLESQGIKCYVFTVLREPTTQLVSEAVDIARQSKIELIIGIGGGSAIDTGKAVSALIKNRGEILDYLEVVGRGKPLQEDPQSFIAIPTTAGTGSEVTKNAVLEVPEEGVNVSLRSAKMYADLALVDPQLTLGLPPNITASSGLDALTQLIEPFVSNRANPLVDAICRQGIQVASRSLKRAYRQGDSLDAREGMSLASLFGGLALANAKLGAVHGFAAPLGGMLHAAHGSICACLLAAVMSMNVQALCERDPQNPVLNKYKEIAVLLTGESDASLEDGIHWVKETCEDLNIPGLRSMGFKEGMLGEAVQKGAIASSMGGNPIQLTQAELESILDSSM